MHLAFVERHVLTGMVLPNRAHLQDGGRIGSDETLTGTGRRMGELG
jgi:hypothetical protein